MSDIISPDDLAGILAEYCRGYTDDVVEKVGDGIENIGMEAAQEVKELSPVSDGNDKSIPKGAYRRSWTCRIEKERGKLTATVYVKGKKNPLGIILILGLCCINGGQ